ISPSHTFITGRSIIERRLPGWARYAMTSGPMADRRPASKLRLVRVAKGWGIGKLAVDVGVAESTIRRLEVGLTEEPSDRVRRALARKLGVAQADLFGKM